MTRTGMLISWCGGTSQLSETDAVAVIKLMPQISVYLLVAKIEISGGEIPAAAVVVQPTATKGCVLSLRTIS